MSWKDVQTLRKQGDVPAADPLGPAGKAHCRSCRYGVALHSAARFGRQFVRRVNRGSVAIRVHRHFPLF